MAVTTTTRLGVTRWSSGTDAFSRSQMDDSHAALETNAAMYAQDVVASRPSAGKSGRVFWATDESKLYYDNGVTWTSIGSGVFLPLSGGTLSGALTAATSYTVTGGSVLAATALTIGSSTTSSTLTAGAGTHSLEFGRRDGSSSSPVMNFHSSGNDISYDSRIVASGGSGSIGQGILSLTAAGGINLNSASVSSAGLVAAVGVTTSAALTLSDTDIVLGTTTGTKVGTSTSQKLGFFNTTPIVQPSGAILTALANLGLIATPSLASSALSDGANIAFINAGNTFTANQTLSNVNVILGTTTGTKIGTSTSQKLSFFNSTPIVQPSGSIITALSNLGLVASPTLASTALSDTADIAYLTSSQTLTNKTLTTPTIASFTNATHDHSNAAGGGTIPASSITKAAWTSYTPTVGGTGWSLGNGSVTGKYVRIGNTVHFAVQMVWGTTTTGGSPASPTFTLPLHANSASSAGLLFNAALWDQNGTLYFGYGHIDSGTWDKFTLYSTAAGSTYTSISTVTNTIPTTWASNDIFTIHGTYETDAA